jgi:hypothetical protein
MERIRHNGLVFYQFKQLRHIEGLSHAVFTRRGGVSPAPYDSLNLSTSVGDSGSNTQANYRRMVESIGINGHDACSTWQVHGADVVVARRGGLPDPLPQADAMITDEPDLVMTMRFADCVPLLFYDPVHHAAGIAHAGWRGTLAGVGPATVTAMAEAYGTQPQDVIAGIGPAIGPCCYEVGPEVIAQVMEALSFGAEVIIQPANGGGLGAHLDLWEANRRALLAIDVQSIELAHICTACNTTEFFSHRAEAGRTGRFGAVIMLQRNHAGV